MDDDSLIGPNGCMVVGKTLIFYTPWLIAQRPGTLAQILRKERREFAQQIREQFEPVFRQQLPMIVEEVPSGGAFERHFIIQAVTA